MTDSSWQSEKKDSDSEKQNLSESQAGMPQTLVILKPNLGSIKTAETFLKNRSWTILSSPNLRKALAWIIQKQPKFVLIAADHPNKKVLKMPKLLRQAFPCHVIGFAESAGSQAMSALHEMGLEYNIYPPISGPAIERMINKIIKDAENRQQNPEQSHLSSASHSGSNPSNLDLDANNFRANTSSSLEQARKTLSLMLAEDSDPEEKKNDDIHYTQGEEKDDSGVIIQRGSSAKTLTSNQNLSNPSPSSLIIEKPYESNWNQPHEAADQSKDSSQNEENKKNDETIIQKATAAALDELALPVQTQNVEKVAESSHVACIVIESAKFNGYLIAALGKNRALDDQFMNLVKERLYAFLKNHGDMPLDKTESPMNLNIQQIEFEDWALEQALFLKKTVHGSEEIAMAFFPTEETKLRLEESVSEKMVKLAVADLREDVSLEFDLYIYMPENQKFLLYTPQGTPLFRRQKDRLLEKGVSHMHLRKESISSVKRFNAQNFLNDKIKEYQSRKKS